MDYSKTLAWAKNQVYIALGQFMTSAAVLGVDACPMEGIVHAEYDRILGLKTPGSLPPSPVPWVTVPEMTNMPSFPRCVTAPTKYYKQYPRKPA